MIKRKQAELLDVAVAYGAAVRSGTLTPAIISALSRAATEYRDVLAASRTIEGLDELIWARWERVAGCGA